jgi:hypothetical protein
MKKSILASIIISTVIGIAGYFVILDRYIDYKISKAAFNSSQCWQSMRFVAPFITGSYNSCTGEYRFEKWENLMEWHQESTFDKNRAQGKLR